MVLTLSRKHKPYYLAAMNPALENTHNVPEPFRAIMMYLQLLVEVASPNAQLIYKWHLPFYYLDKKSLFCFLNYRKTFADLGLAYGDALRDKQGVSIAGENRNMMRPLCFYKLEDIDDTVVIETLQELELLRETTKKTRS